MRGATEPLIVREWCRLIPVLIGGVVMTCLLWPGVGWAKGKPDNSQRLRPGAVEVGLAGSLVTVEGIASGSGSLRGALFREMLGGLGGFEADATYTHVSSLDEFELGGAVSWQKRVGDAANYPYVSVGGGLRYLEVGSFDHTRYPVGFAVGLRSLLGRRAGVRVEYRFRRILNDPVADFSEHRIVLGVSLFLRNGGSEPVIDVEE